MSMDGHLNIGAIVFPDIDQLDFTGPFEVFSRLANASFHILWKEKIPVRDMRGLILTPEKTFSEAPPLDLLIVPGGYGQQALMGDETVLSFIRRQAGQAKYVMSVCTGALICGAAGLLRGRRATTNWTVFHLLRQFGAIPVDERVVVDGNYISTAGVTAGIDGALLVTALLRGPRMAEQIQLYIEYAPEPPFRAGSPKTAAPDLVETARTAGRAIAEARLETAKRVAQRLGVGS